METDDKIECVDLCPQDGLEPDEAKRIWAVIEAAKAFRVAWLLDEDERRQMALLLEAIEALQEVEGD